MSRRALNAFHFAYYGLASLAFLRMVGKSWFYGFFFTPFPAVLTVLFLFTGIFALISLLDLFRPLGWLGDVMPLEMRRRNIVREATLFLCLLPFIYLSFAFSAKSSSFTGSPSAIEKADLLIDVDGALFGPKRAERLMAKFARHAQQAGQYEVADRFLHQRLNSLENHNRSLESITEANLALIENHISMRESHRVPRCIFDKCDPIPAHVLTGAPLSLSPGMTHEDAGSVFVVDPSVQAH